MEISEDLMKFLELRAAIEEGPHGIGDCFIAMLPDEDNFEETERVGNALLDDMARFAGSYIAQGCVLTGYDAKLHLEDFVSTLRQSFNETMLRECALDDLAETADALGGY